MDLIGLGRGHTPDCTTCSSYQRACLGPCTEARSLSFLPVEIAGPMAAETATSLPDECVEGPFLGFDTEVPRTLRP